MGSDISHRLMFAIILSAIALVANIIIVINFI